MDSGSRTPGTSGAGTVTEEPDSLAPGVPIGYGDASDITLGEPLQPSFGVQGALRRLTIMRGLNGHQ